jgi:hypothetical protein
MPGPQRRRSRTCGCRRARARDTVPKGRSAVRRRKPVIERYSWPRPRLERHDAWPPGTGRGSPSGPLADRLPRPALLPRAERRAREAAAPMRTALRASARPRARRRASPRTSSDAPPTRATSGEHPPCHARARPAATPPRSGKALAKLQTAATKRRTRPRRQRRLGRRGIRIQPRGAPSVCSAPEVALPRPTRPIQSLDTGHVEHRASPRRGGAEVVVARRRGPMAGTGSSSSRRRDGGPPRARRDAACACRVAAAAVEHAAPPPAHVFRGVRALGRRGVDAIQLTHEFANLAPARKLARGVPGDHAAPRRLGRRPPAPRAPPARRTPSRP